MTETTVENIVSSSHHDADHLSNRERLLEEAIKVIEEHGEAALRVGDVSARAGVRHPSVYHYFGNRDGLIVAAQTVRYYRSVMHSIAPLGESLDAASSREEYIRILDATIRSFSDAPGIARRRVRREVLGSSVFRPELARQIDLMTQEQVSSLVAAFQSGLDRGWITSPYDLDAVMMWWVGTIQGRMFVDESGDQRLSDQWDDLVARAVVRALFGAAAVGDP